MNLKLRYPFWFFEHCVFYRKNSQLVAQSENHKITIPLSDLGFILIGSGCKISSNLISLASRSGGTLAVSSSSQVPTAIITTASIFGNAAMAVKQAKIVSSPAAKLSAAKRMLARKFPEKARKIKDAKKTRDLFGIEGPIMRATYREVFGDSFIRMKRHGTDELNFRVNILYNALYCLSFVAITEYGLSPHLGLIHGRKRFSFVYDLADLFKTSEYLVLARDATSIKEMLDNLSRAMHRNRIFLQMEEVIKDVFNCDEKDMEEPYFSPKDIDHGFPEEDLDAAGDDDFEE